MRLLPCRKLWPRARRAAVVLLNVAALGLFVAAQPADHAPATGDSPPPPLEKSPQKTLAAEKGAAEGLADVATERPGAFRVRVPLPITGDVDVAVKRAVNQLLDGLPAGAARPVLVLEFRAESPADADASEFERSLALARFLSSSRASRARAVAWLPDGARGHAVLAALGCEEIVMRPDAEFGAAGVKEEAIDEAMRQGYLDIAERRRVIPPAVALGLLDARLEVFKVQTKNGVVYALAEELAKLREDAVVETVDTVIPAGEPGLFTGRDLRHKYRFVSHLASDLQELSEALRLPAGALTTGGAAFGGKWKALRVELRGPVHGKSVNWIQQALRQRVASGETNLVLLILDSPGGAPIESMRLANYLASLEPMAVRTVAYLSPHARADAALIAAGCDQIVVQRDSVLGGPGAYHLGARDLEDLKLPLQALAKRKQRDWSPWAALVDPRVSLGKYERQGTGETRYISEEERNQQTQPERWDRRQDIATAEGIAGPLARDIGLAALLADDFAEVLRHYQVVDPPAELRPNWAFAFIEELSSPWIAGWLLFGAWFCLYLEFMQPGIGVAGFLSGVCFLLYFWSQFLHGNAGWLEILLFLGGAVSLGIELFLLPGFGVFGVGGITMIVVSIILASQTFVIPQNSYQLWQLPYSLSMVLAGFAGLFVSAVLASRFLPHTPVLNRVMLPPPQGEELAELARRETLARWEHLQGQSGVASTQLTPSGKARFGDELVDVISDGELIPRGAKIVVVSVQGSRVLVRPD